MIILYHNDLDGQCAAAIIMKKFGKTDPSIAHAMDYGQAIPYEKMEGKYVYIVDFCLKPEAMEKTRSKSLGVYWCDHHASAKDYPYQDLPGVRDFAEYGKAGCECTWEYLHRDKIPPMVELIGDYDTWRHNLKPRSAQFHAGMKIQDTNPGSEIWNHMDDEERINQIIEDGKKIIPYRDNYCTDIRNRFGYEAVIIGFRAKVMNVCGFGSPMFGEEYDKYDICISYVFDGTHYRVSLYSGTVDVSVIAKRFGGGGHKGASGFICKELPFTRCEP
jgi:oligoribonuclease NrnB/cAMP/cGMP phosphodiesterase (DHH superfamily)